MTDKQYQTLVKKTTENSSTANNVLKAFSVGGAICLLGEAICSLYEAFGADEETKKTLCSLTLIFLGVLFSALHLYDKLAKIGGAGTLVPITGFANAMSSAAIEFKAEGFITGVGVKLFSIAGPVIVFGTISAMIYGLIYWLTTLF